MSTLAKLLVELGLNSGAYTSGLDEVEKKTNSSSVNITKHLGTIGITAGKILVGGVALAGAAVVGLGAAISTTIGPASDLNETVSKSSVVFGDYAGQIEEMGDYSAASLGMSKNAAMGAAATYGNLFRSMGMGQGMSADMSESLVNLAADLASFNNIDPTEALEKLRAGLVGESEPLKSLGININETILQQKALDMGLIKAKQPLTALTKAQAAYALIMEQSKLAQGDFARTSTGLANQQRILRASIENVRASIGTAFLPIINKVMNLMTSVFNNPAFKAGIDKVIGFVTKVSDVFIGMIDDLLAGADIGVIFDDFKEGIADFVPPGVIDALNSFYDGIRNVYTIISQFVTNSVIPFVQKHMPEIKGALIGIGVVIAGGMIVSGITAIVGAIAALANPVTLIIALAALLGAAWAGNWGGIRDTLTRLWTGTLQPIFSQIWSWLQVNIPIALAWLSNTWGTVLLPAIQSVWAWIQGNLFPLFSQIWTWLQVNIPLAIQTLANFWQSVLWPAIQTAMTSISDFIKNAWETIKGIFQAATVGFIQPLIAAFTAAIHGDWFAFGEKLRVVWDNIWNGIKTILGAAWEWIKTTVKNIIDNIINFFKGTDWGGVGTNIVQGIAAGLRGAVSWVIDAARDVAGAALGAIRGFLGIKSPSMMFYRIGEMMMAGMAQGIRENAQMPALAALGAAGGTLQVSLPRGYGGGNSSVNVNQYVSGEMNMAHAAWQVVDLINRNKR